MKNRGSLSNPHGRFDILRHEAYDDGWETFDEEEIVRLDTILYPEKAKSIISRNDSPDISFEQSINPYRGCEHGCIYCYARPAHGYVGLSPGLDFETKIFYKENAAMLLENELRKPSYECKTIVIGANTDPYQPTEAKLKVTRSLLEVLHRYQHPVAIITKGSLITRDIDLLSDMAQKNLARVAISVTTLTPSLKQILEPRTSAPKARLRVIRHLSEAGIPVSVMAAPMIPMINDVELEEILKQAKLAGAINAGFTLVRLPYEVKDLFKEWLTEHYPDRAEHVMSIIRQMRGGKDYEATFGKRMRGEGEFAKLLAMRFKIACQRYQLNKTASKSLSKDLFIKPPKNSAQMTMAF